MFRLPYPAPLFSPTLIALAKQHSRATVEPDVNVFSFISLWNNPPSRPSAPQHESLTVRDTGHEAAAHESECDAEDGAAEEAAEGALGGGADGGEGGEGGCVVSVGVVHFGVGCWVCVRWCGVVWVRDEDV